MVAMIRGPLRAQGLRGILLRKGKRHHLVRGVRLIQQLAAAEIDMNEAQGV